MTPKLILAAEVKPGMYIEGHPGWWRITEVDTFKMLGCADVVTIDWRQGGKHYGTQFPPTAYVLVGVTP